MAVILPVSKHENNIYFFFGREALIPETGHSGLWSDFGGSTENNETKIETAIREGHEETSGIIGNKYDINHLIKHKLITKISTKTYTSFLIEIDYDKQLPAKLKKIYDNALKYLYDDVIKANGLYEKDRGKWIRLERLKYNMDIFRPWYKKIVYKIIDYFYKETANNK